MDINYTFPILVLVRGLPGSGKSYLVNKFVEKLNTDTIVLDPDATNYESHEYRQMCQELSSENVDPKFFPYRFLRRQAHEGIKNNKLIIWNQAFTQLDGFQKTIINLSNFASENNKKIKILIIEVFVDPEVAKLRIKNRVESGGHDVPEERFNKFVDDYKTFANEGYPVLSIDGQANIDESVKSVIDFINSA